MDELSTIKQVIEKDFECFKTYYSSLFVSDNPLLNQILPYLAKSNGKMVRPLLVLLVAKALAPINTSAYMAAASMQLLHAASLLHDDVVDDSTLRHGNPSINSVFNNKVAVLAGDHLLSSALHQVSLTSNVTMVQLVSELGLCLSDGELWQLSSNYRASLSEELYFEVIHKKTAIFFSICTALGALSANSSDEMVSRFKCFGENIGICFQIRDDVFDYYEDAELGKPTGNDIREGKLTLPAIYAINHFGNEQTTAILKRMKDDCITDDDIHYLTDFTVKNGGIEYAFKTMEHYKQLALSTLPPTLSQDSLEVFEAVSNYFINRNK